MANEILTSTLGDLRVAEILSRMVLLSLADRNALQMHPALVYVGDLVGSGSTTLKTSEIGWMGADLLVNTAEGVEVANTQLTDDSHTVTVARFAKSYAPSDLARISDSLGHLDPSAFSQDAVASAAMTLTDLIAQQVGGFTATAGTPGAQFTVGDYFVAMATMRAANVQGPWIADLHSAQYNQFLTSLRSETGALEHTPATAEQLALRGTGFVGEYLGVDIFVSNRVPTANAGVDRAGGLFGRGAILWGDASFVPDPAVIGTDLGKVRLEFSRNGRKGETAAVTSYNVGVSQGIDAAGVSIITSAT